MIKGNAQRNPPESLCDFLAKKIVLSFEGVESKSTKILSFKGLKLYQVYVTFIGNLNPRRQKNHHLKKITVIEKNPH